VNNGNETALSAAEFLGLNDFARALTEVGAVRPPGPTEQIFCDRENREPFMTEKLIRLIETCRLTSIESVLALLPRTIRSNYIFNYSGRGLQEGSEAYPRVFAFNGDGRFFMTFNGHPSQNKFNSL
jgi:hypothetical protein